LHAGDTRNRRGTLGTNPGCRTRTAHAKKGRSLLGDAESQKRTFASCRLKYVKKTESVGDSAPRNYRRTFSSPASLLSEEGQSRDCTSIPSTGVARRDTRNRGGALGTKPTSSAATVRVQDRGQLRKWPLVTCIVGSRSEGSATWTRSRRRRSSRDPGATGEHHS
jgi:hypothetical protein